jgi:hypothetical protein
MIATVADTIAVHLTAAELEMARLAPQMTWMTKSRSDQFAKNQT